MVRAFLYISACLLFLSSSYQANADATCPTPEQVEKTLNAYTEKNEPVKALDDFKVETNDATKIDNSYILIILGDSHKRAEISQKPLKNVKNLYKGPIDATEHDVRDALKYKAKMLEQKQSVCGYIAEVEGNSIPVYIGKPKTTQHGTTTPKQTATGKKS